MKKRFTPLSYAAVFILLVVATLFYAIAPPIATAQEAGQALEIAPPVLNLTADPGETIQTKIALRDISSSSLFVTSEINDFTANGEDGTPKVLLDSSEPSPYSIIDWIEPIPNTTLKPRQIENMPVTINVPDNAAPGGYYGVIRFTGSAPQPEGNGASLSASIGALVFIRVNGDAKQEMDIVEFFASNNGKKSSIFNGIPIGFTQRIENKGTVHEQPIGRILVTDMFGKPTVNMNVNLEGRNVLPGSVRRFDEPLNEKALGDRSLFGRYTATLTFKYGGDDQTVTESLTFWVIPYKMIIGVIVGIIALVIIGRIALQRYNDWILSQHSGRGSRGRRR